MKGECIHNPFRHLLPLKKVCNLIQAIEQEQELAPFKKFLPEVFWSIQMGIIQFLLNKIVQPMVQVLQVA